MLSDSFLDSINRLYNPRPLSGKSSRSSLPRNSIKPSSFRPSVPAVDRLQGWRTPYSIDFDFRLKQKFSAETVDKFFAVLGASLDDNTKTNYASGLLRFTQFCDLEGVPEHERMPASPELLASFAAHYAGKVSGTFLDLVAFPFTHTF